MSSLGDYIDTPRDQIASNIIVPDAPRKKAQATRPHGWMSSKRRLGFDNIVVEQYEVAEIREGLKVLDIHNLN